VQAGTIVGLRVLKAVAREAGETQEHSPLANGTRGEQDWLCRKG
jgi:hypothetical protein